MSIPDYQSIMYPLIGLLSSGDEKSIREIYEGISNKFQLTDSEKVKLLPSGRQPIIENRVGWAKTYLLKAGLLESTRRGFIRITSRGKEVLNNSINRIDINYLLQFQEFQEFRNLNKEEQKEIEVQREIKETINSTPDELIEYGVNRINDSLAQELLDRLRNNPPSFFERVVLQLLINMGYGQGNVTGKTGDGGVDGFVNEDKLGLAKIFFQAKRYKEDNPVTTSNLRDFVGTLEVNGVNKGVFMTTSRFPKDSEIVLSKTQKSIVLIDGPKLVNLMIEYNVGVTTVKTISIKKIDSDFFLDE
jgi:restriction system protein